MNYIEKNEPDNISESNKKKKIGTFHPTFEREHLLLGSMWSWSRDINITLCYVSESLGEKRVLVSLKVKVPANQDGLVVPQWFFVTFLAS